MDRAAGFRTIPPTVFRHVPNILTGLRLVLAAAPELDAWTIFHALRTPSGVFEGRAPIYVVKKGQAIGLVVTLVLEELGIHAKPA